MENKFEIIYLCGFSGSGKTETGRILAKELNYEFTDTDETVEMALNKPIEEIFAKMGEAKFRFAEGDVIRMAIGNPPRVISLGGGAIQDERRLKFIKETGCLIYLQTSAESIYERLKQSHLRPLLQVLNREDGPEKQAVMDRINKLLDEREPIYLKADKIISTDGKTSEEVAQEIKDLIA